MQSTSGRGNLSFAMIRFGLIILLFVIQVPAAATSQTAGVRALIDTFMHAVNAKDVKEFGSVFTEDAEFTNPVGMTAKGRSAIESFHAVLFSENNKPSFAHAHLKLLGSTIRFIRPDVAAVDVKWEQTGAVDPTGQPWGTRRGVLSWVVTRDKGEWRIAVWHNLELPHSQ